MWASEEGHLEVVKALLAVGADKEARDEVGEVPGMVGVGGKHSNRGGGVSISGVVCMQEGAVLIWNLLCVCCITGWQHIPRPCQQGGPSRGGPGAQGCRCRDHPSGLFVKGGGRAVPEPPAAAGVLQEVHLFQYTK